MSEVTIVLVFGFIMGLLALFAWVIRPLIEGIREMLRQDE